MKNNKKSNELTLRMQSDDWINQQIRALETGVKDGRQLSFEERAECFFQLLGVAAHIDHSRQQIGLGSGSGLYDEVKRLYSWAARGVFFAPVKKGDILYDVCPPDEVMDVPAVICEEEVLEVSDSRVWVDGAYMDHDEIGRSVFLSREAAQEYIDRTWGSEREAEAL